MDITAKKYNLLRLWLQGFVVTNKSTGKLIVAMLCMALLLGCVVAVLILGFGKENLSNTLQSNSLLIAATTGNFIPYLIMTIGNLLFTTFFYTVIAKILASEALQHKTPLTEIFSGSVWPTLFLIVVRILLGVAAFGLAFLMFLFGRFLLLGIIFVILILFLAVRISYVGPAIMVDNKGPIEGLIRSWDITSGLGYLDALLMCLLFMVCFCLPWVVMVAAGYGLYIAIPLYFPNIFDANISPLIWLVLGVMFIVFLVFYYIACMAFPILAYLNRNAMLYAPAQQDNSNHIFIQLPELDTPANQAAASGAAQGAEGLATSTPQNPQTITNPDEHPTMQTLQMESLGVTKESVNISEKDADKISKHLDQVHTPQTENMVQQAEEDRMPTIVFDDQLAKQLEDSIIHGTVPTDKKNIPPEDEGPVKLSK